MSRTPGLVPTPALVPQTTAGLRSLDAAGMRRSYLVVAPARLHADLPLLVVLHGRAVTVQQEAVRTGFLPLAQRGEAIIVYPIGFAQSWNAGHGCCGQAAVAGVNDTDFVADVVADAERQLSIDPSRVYLVGYSNGGKLAFREVCDHPTTFAAFATYGAVPLEPCTNRRAPAIPALISAGTADSELTTTDPPRTATHAVDEAVARWRVRDGCSQSATTTRIAPVTEIAWADCRNGSAVGSAMYSGVTHYWPSSGSTSVPFSAAVDPQAAAATVMWGFLSHHRS